MNCDLKENWQLLGANQKCRSWINPGPTESEPAFHQGTQVMLVYIEMTLEKSQTDYS